GKAVNAGQTCVAPDYLLIHESKFQEFKDEMRKEFHKYYGDSHEHWHQSPHLSRIINDRNFSRIKGYVDDAVRGGAKIEIGGHFRTEEKYISPTLISNVKLDSDIMKEEIFGPVLPVMTYNNINSVYDIIHSMEKPLALYIFSENKKNIREIIRNTSSGGAVINGVLVHLLNAHLPFGGVNNSGIGSYHGWFGFKDFSHERSVLKLSKLTKISMFFPPYTKLKGALGTFARKYLV
ncbi:MAG: aldehyde dehydrogenase family protein, partial [Leptospira sp.]|nr:aldehyde dehydrogenase family protein [Leptospira sp.]